MKRYLVVLLALALCVGFVFLGCGKGDEVILPESEPVDGAILIFENGWNTDVVGEVEIIRRPSLDEFGDFNALTGEAKIVAGNLQLTGCGQNYFIFEAPIDVTGAYSLVIETKQTESVDLGWWIGGALLTPYPKGHLIDTPEGKETLTLYYASYGYWNVYDAVTYRGKLEFVIPGEADKRQEGPAKNKDIVPFDASKLAGFTFTTTTFNPGIDITKVYIIADTDPIPAGVVRRAKLGLGGGGVTFDGEDLGLISAIETGDKFSLSVSFYANVDLIAGGDVLLLDQSANASTPWWTFLGGAYGALPAIPADTVVSYIFNFTADDDATDDSPAANTVYLSFTAEEPFDEDDPDYNDEVVTIFFTKIEFSKVLSF